MKRWLAGGAWLAMAACSASTTPTHDATLDSLRRHARWGGEGATREAALAELVAPGGDADAGTRTLERLRAHHGDDVRVRFGLALTELQHGAFEAAASDLAATIEAARTGRDPLGPALAEVAVTRLISVRGDVRDFEHTFRPVVEHVVSDPGNLGASATVELLETATRWARERGFARDETRWTRATGCATGWTVAGPFGPLPMLRFDESLPPEAPGPLANDYDIGPGRGRRATWPIRARGCASNLGHGQAETGVFVAATDVVLDAPVPDAVLEVESPNTFEILVDGVDVGRLDSRVRATPTSLSVPLSLAAGRHTIRVKIASRFSSPLLVTALTDARGSAVGRFEPALAAAHAEPPAAPPPERDLADAGLDDPHDPFTRYVAVELAFARRNAVLARELLRPLVVQTAAAPTALAQIAWGSVALSDTFTAPGVARDRARRAFDAVRTSETAHGGTPRSYYPLLALARLAAADDRADEALALQREGYARFPDNPEVQSDLVDQLLERNWDGEAREVVEHAMRQLPGACWPLRSAIQLAQRHGDGQAEHALADRMHACDALSDAGAIAAVRERRWGDARAEYSRLLSNDPEGRAFRRAMVDLERQRGHLREAERAGTELLQENPDDTSLREDLVDMRLALGHRAEAVALLDHEIARAPSQMAELLRYRAALTGREDLEPWRQDGNAVLRRFQASGHHYDAAAVLVLDYTVRREYADGSALELTHNIVHLQSQEGVDEHATFNPPQGAEILRLRTHKADGRVLEPDAIARLDAIAFPDVHIGDSIEFEYLRTLSPSDASPGGFSADRFYFRGFDIPYDHSEFVTILPREMAMNAVVDPRGPAPTTHRRELPGGLVEYRWFVDESHRLTPEVRSIAIREFVPSVDIGAGATWDRFVDALRDRLADEDPWDGEAARTTAQVVGDARRATDKLARLHRWVTDHIDQEGGGTPFASAPSMLSARSGHRGRVLRYMLRLAGVPCDMALVHQANGDATDSPLADEETYPSIMLRVRTERGVEWVTPSERGAPAAHIPPALAGQRALVLVAGAPRVTLPLLDPAAHTREVVVHMHLAADGSATADVTERLRGEWAITWRQSLREIEPANLDHEFESYVGHQVTAASLTSLHIEGQDDPDAPIVLHYTFTAPDVATLVGDALAFDGIYTAEVGAAYASLPRRTTTMYNSEPLNASLDLTVSLPPGARLGPLPAARTGSAPGVEWSTRRDATPDGFRYQRRVHVPAGRVSSADYPAFATQIRAFDTADQQRIAISLR